MQRLTKLGAQDYQMCTAVCKIITNQRQTQATLKLNDNDNKMGQTKVICKQMSEKSHVFQT